MKIIYCPVCGNRWVNEAPDTCEHCGCQSTKFIIHDENYQETKSDYKPIPFNNNADEETTRMGASVIFVIYLIAGIICFIAGCVLASSLSVSIGLLIIILGILLAITGWLLKAFIRIFANMSERLTNIDNKIKWQG